MTTATKALLLGLAVLGCSFDPRRASLGLAPAIDPEPWQYAVDEWRRASSGQVQMTATTSDDADVSIAFSVFAPATACAYTEGDEIRIQIDEPPGCVSTRRGTATHELGHVLGADDSSDPRDVMYRKANGVEVLTAHDVAMALEGVP